MKIIHSSGFYFPDSTGGTEVYIDGLARELEKRGTQNIIAAAQPGREEAFYTYNHLPVYRYPVSPQFSHQQVQGNSPHGGFNLFQQWLSQQDASIYHQHSWTTGCNMHHLKAAKQQGLKTVVTIHVPGNVCVNGTMLRNSTGDTTEVCDGQINTERCSLCWIRAKGLTPLLARPVAHIPESMSASIGKLLPNSKINTLLSTPHIIAAHRERLLNMAKVADRIVAVCQWLYDALLINGVPKRKLVLCRQGIAASTFSFSSRAFRKDKPLRIGFLGRWAPIKGIHVLVEAMRQLPEAVDVEVLIYAIAQTKHAEAYKKQVIRQAEEDTRIKFCEPVPNAEVRQVLTSFDILAVPSQCLETGPLVVLEAQSVGTPVLGSNIGGISELIENGLNGWLVKHDDINDWAQKISILTQEKAKIRFGLSTPTVSVRTVDQTAEEMAILYAEIAGY